MFEEIFKIPLISYENTDILKRFPHCISKFVTDINLCMCVHTYVKNRVNSIKVLNQFKLYLIWNKTGTYREVYFYIGSSFCFPLFVQLDTDPKVLILEDSVSKNGNKVKFVEISSIL